MKETILKTPLATKASAHFMFSKGSKGKLTTKHNNKRAIINQNDEDVAICLAMGGTSLMEETINNFKTLNVQSESKADGIIYNSMHLYKLTDRVVKRLFGIGSSRLNRIKHNLDKGKPGGLNGTEVIIV